MISLYILQTLCIILVTRLSAAANDRAVAFLDITNTSAYNFEQVKEILEEFATGRIYDIFSVVMKREDQIDLIRPFHLPNYKLQAHFDSSPDKENETENGSVFNKDVISWLSTNPSKMVLCFTRDGSLPYTIINARRKGLISSQMKIVSILDDPVDFKDSNNDALTEHISTVVFYSDFLLFGNNRIKDFLFHVVHTRDLNHPRNILLNKLSAGRILDSSHLTKTIPFITEANQRQRFRRNAILSSVSLNLTITSTSLPLSSSASFTSVSSSLSTALSSVSSISSNATYTVSPSLSDSSFLMAQSSSSALYSTTSALPSLSFSSYAELSTSVTSSSYQSVTPSPTTAASEQPSSSVTRSIEQGATQSTSFGSSSLASQYTSVGSSFSNHYSSMSSSESSSIVASSSSFATEVATSYVEASSFSVSMIQSAAQSTSVYQVSTPQGYSTRSPSPPAVPSSSMSSPQTSIAMSSFSQSIFTTQSFSSSQMSPEMSSFSSVIVLESSSVSVSSSPESSVSSETIDGTSSSMVTSQSISTTPHTSSVAASSTSTSMQTSIAILPSSSVTTISPSSLPSSKVPSVSPTHVQSFSPSLSSLAESKSSVALTSSTSVPGKQSTISPTMSSMSPSFSSSSPKMSGTLSSIASSSSSVPGKQSTISPTMSSMPSSSSSSAPKVSVTLSSITSSSSSIPGKQSTTYPSMSSLSVSSIIAFSPSSSILKTSSKTLVPSSSTTSKLAVPTSSVSLQPSASVTTTHSTPSVVPSPTMPLSYSSTSSSSSVSRHSIKTSVSPSPHTSTQPVSTVTITTPKPTTAPQLETLKYKMTLDGDCETIVSNSDKKEEFVKQLKKIIAKLLSISVEQISIDKVGCGSIEVTLTITKVTKDAANTLEKAVEDGKVKVEVDGKSYVASKLEAITTPTTEPQLETLKYKMTLNGDCETIVSNSDKKEEFKKQLKKVIASILSISVEQISINDIICGSVEVTLTITKVTKDAANTLKKAVEDNKVKVEADGKSYVASKLEAIPTGPTSGSSSSSDKKLAFWLYVSFGAAMGLIFLVGMIILLVRCRRDRVTRTFTLNTAADLELKRYQGIPRASYYRVEMYGDPVEVDAANAGIDEEYDGEVVPYEQTDITLPAARQGSDSNANRQGDFGMGNLPEWDVPKLKSSDVIVHNHDALHAYDNPIMSFGGSTKEINNGD